jgi:translation initiation factor 1A
MPNNKGGKKYKKNKKFQQKESKKLVFKNEEEGEEGQEYGKITKVNGSGRFQVQCFDGQERLGICAGKIKKRVRINIGDIVLFCKWDFQDEKCSIIYKYEDYEVEKLISMKEIPEQRNDNDFDYDDSIIFDNSIPEETEDNSGEEETEDKQGGARKAEDFVIVNEHDAIETTDKLVYRTHEGVAEIDFKDI